VKTTSYNKSRLIRIFLIVVFLFLVLFILSYRFTKIRNSLPFMTSIVNNIEEWRLTRNVQKHPYSAIAHFKLAINYLQKDDLQRYETELGKAYQYDPSFIGIIYSVGNPYEAKHQFEKSLALYQIGARIDKEFRLPFHYEIGRMYLNLGKSSEALCAYEEALDHIDKYNMIIDGKENIKKDLQMTIKDLKSKGIKKKCTE
jgi:tetratricopeptide (TPR) repeat protein